MFSSGTKRSNVSTRKHRSLAQVLPDSTPITPNSHSSIPNRPHTGTPAPWAPRLSVLARISPGNNTERGGEADSIKPVYVGEFPQVVRDQQASFLQDHIPDDGCICGGMDKETCLSWIICGNKLFIWSYLSSTASKDCIVLELPTVVSEISKSSHQGGGGSWMLCVVNWSCRKSKVVQSCKSAGVVLCSQKTRAVIYWPDVLSEMGSTPVSSLPNSDEFEETSSPVYGGKFTAMRQRQHNRLNSSAVGSNSFNSLISSSLSATEHVCIALACSANGDIWSFYCSPSGIQRSKAYQDIKKFPSQGGHSGQYVRGKGYPRSLTWRFSDQSMEGSVRQFFLLTDLEIQCFTVTFDLDVNVSELWSYEIVGTDADLGIKKDLAGQKQIWPLDLQVDVLGKVITVLVATFCKDRVSSSSYTQYSLLTMQYKSGANAPSDDHGRILEKKGPIQVIIPKARVEDEEFLFSMKIRVGGKPLGSVVILSGDGTATVYNCCGNSTRLYQFDLPYDAGKVLDASILPVADDVEDGAWVLLTEKAGIWAIPEKAIKLGGVEPPQRSLSRKGSMNETTAQEERKNLALMGNMALRRISSEAWGAGDRQGIPMTGLAPYDAQEESEALLGQLFHDFLTTGKVDDSFENLEVSGAFEKDGETNVFARTSKAIVDTLAKHWTTTRGAEVVAMANLSSQLVDKQQKHERFLQFLALSKCHEELCSRQRKSLQLILEHGEKLAGMIQLRELQSLINQNRSTVTVSPHYSSEPQLSGALWDLIQLVGDRARRNTVLLMDRDNAEVFYSKVSDLEELFNGLDKHLEYVVSEEQLLEVQIQRACELSNSIVSVVRTAMVYRNKHHMWYPPPEGLTPWYCQPVVRNGLWRVASFMLRLLDVTSGLDISAKSDLYNHLSILAEVLLDAYAGAITAKVECGEEYGSLLNEYWNRRDTLLDSLYLQVKHFANERHQIFNIGSDEKNEEILRKLSPSLLSIAKRHEGYNTMWSICSDLNDSVLLTNLMRESMGPNGGFSYFVCTKLYEKRQFSKLLRLGEEFQEELSAFLKHHQDLLWLHEIFLHQFSSASETLHALALSQDANSLSEAEDGAGAEITGLITSLADRKRFLYLSKIAAMAGKAAYSEAKVKRVEADLRILKIQEEVMEVIPTNEVMEYGGRQLLRPEELIELCLKSQNPELALRAFEVFAWTSSSYRKSHRNLLEECWKNAADQDDWGQLQQACRDEGWSDDETLQQLRDTVLFQASRRCYGPEAETIDEGFDEVLPLRKESSEFSTLKHLDVSVEAILMQHKDFPDAGKLMLTSIMLGSLNDVKAEDGHTPME
ncbi:hypothetical protein K2173_007578 [Erythroxylum novogranatense]|uniref:Nuclear pore complex protein NUP133 n=1 Tax=Erythroxylum novogranatense TaxID=1862640 RepID=A0AAV8S8V4_9ROSI|nr:hypothetical protein K2173_007578 [Erythroxylum novogranatense]